MHRHANIRHVCETYGAQVLGITPDDITFSVAKMFFAYGIGNSVFFPLLRGRHDGARAAPADPDVVRERLEQTSPTLFFGVPTFYAALTASDAPRRRVRVGAAVRLGRRAVAGAAAAAVHRPVRRGDPRRHRLDRGAAHLLVQPARRHPPGYDGRGGARLRRSRCATPTGPSSTDGEPGALHVRGESIALGYWHRTEATRQVFQGEWLVTGDTYVRDEDGYYRCLGRNSDMLKAGGIWVSPAEVESRLLEHPAVREAAVVGVADADGLDKPVAVVVVGGDDDPDELVQWCRDGLAHFKAPRQVVFVDDLPKTATGKLQRFKVRALVVARRPASRDPETTEPRSGDVRSLMSELEVDILIVGAGPSGCTAPTTPASAASPCAVVDSLSQVGGQVTAMYPEKQIYDIAGLPRCTGRELVAGLVAQAAQYEPTYLLGQEAQDLGEARRRAGCRSSPPARAEVTCGARRRHRRHRHVHATAAARRRGVPRPRAGVLRARRHGRTSARTSLIVGGGDSAIDWCLMLEPLAASVTLVHRRDGVPRPRRPASSRSARSGVEIITNAQVTALEGGKVRRAGGRRGQGRGRAPRHRLPARSWPRSASPPTSARCASGASSCTTTATSSSTPPCAPTCPASSRPATSPTTTARCG